MIVNTYGGRFEMRLNSMLTTLPVDGSAGA